MTCRRNEGQWIIFSPIVYNEDVYIEPPTHPGDDAIIRVIPFFLYRMVTEVAYTYSYDALGQLIRVNDPNDPTAGTTGTTWVYEYDRGGNILSKSYYSYTTGTPGAAIDTIAYSYTDNNWKDKLTAYDGQTITYDAIGNPLNDGTWTYTWEKGRQLKQMSKSGMTVEFKYDHNGLRTQKKVTIGSEVTTTEYTLHGKLITHLARGEDEMHFFYDAQSRPAMVEFNGTLYGYVHNLQGDVVGIVDNTGSLVVEYKYDAWGKPVVVRTLTTAYETLAELNPFRYRGYVYDEDTGLYYLSNRYYNSQAERFINADTIVCPMSASYGYCNNNPPITIDLDGYVTFGIGTTSSVAFFLRFSYTSQFVFDSHGNIGRLKSASVGIGSPTASMGLVVTVTSADTIFGLEGVGVQAGGSISVLGGEYSTASDAVTGDRVHGGSVELSPISLVPIPELHFDATFTEVEYIYANSRDRERSYESIVENTRRVIPYMPIEKANEMIQATYKVAENLGVKKIEILI